jgi:hypothetical protein
MFSPSAHSAPSIKQLIRRDETTQRYSFSGDNWHMSLSHDDTLFASLNDGFGGNESIKGSYNSRLFKIVGDPSRLSFEDVSGFPELLSTGGSEVNRYYGFGTLSLKGYIYHYLSTPNHTFLEPNPKFVGVKIIYSPDNGATWHNQDGSTPVRWEGWQARSRENMLFFEEEHDAFAAISIAQMGRNYEHNRDGYVYGYTPNGSTEGSMNEIVLFRAPTGELLDRSAYEFFAGATESGGARWTRDIGARVPVLTMPSGWVNKHVHPWAWLPSVTYNAPLGVFMMANWATGPSPTGMWFAKPSYLGFWTAPNPWGPWSSIHEETAWMPEGDMHSRAYSPQIVPKWIAQDGKSFWLAWTDYQIRDQESWERFVEDFHNKLQRKQIARADWQLYKSALRMHMPYYGYNMQRVDLITK